MTDVSNDNIEVKRINNFSIPGGGSFRIETCHNVYLDTTIAKLYLSGCNISGGGVLVFDLSNDPWNPEFERFASQRYSHDNYSRDDIIYSADVFDGVLRIIDSNNDVLGEVITGTEFCHNVWISDDGNYAFTTDERPNAFVESYDISDPSDIEFLDAYQPADTKGTGVIPHNTHYIDGYLVTSYYTDGLKIIDAHRPDNLVEVASYDTYLDREVGFFGLWGTTPYLPSGLILGSDINSGLYVWEPTYQRASYVEGIVKDLNTGAGIIGAEISFTANGTMVSDQTDARGQFKTGSVGNENFSITFSAPGYTSQTLDDQLEPGEIVSFDVSLAPKESSSISVTVLDKETGEVIPNSAIKLSNDVESFTAFPGNDGISEIDAFLETYEIKVEAWGYSSVELNVDLNETSEVTVELLQGAYTDDFDLDLGWTATRTATSGAWTRAIPAGTRNTNVGLPIAIGFDVDSDKGDLAYITGNGNASEGSDDIDAGDVILSSPDMDLSGMNAPTVSFYHWFFRGGGNTASTDSMYVFLVSDNERIELFNTKDNPDDWELVEDLVITGIDLSVPVRLEILAFDREAGNLVEAGIDDVRVFDANPVNSEETLDENLKLFVFPNPTQDYWRATLDEFWIGGSLTIYNSIGQQVSQQLITTTQLEIGQTLANGTYTVRVIKDHASTTASLVKMR